MRDGDRQRAKEGNKYMGPGGYPEEREAGCPELESTEIGR